jgi:O-methyltransferase
MGGTPETVTAGDTTDLSTRYLDLVERALTFSLYDALDSPPALPEFLRHRVNRLLRRHGHAAVRLLDPSAELREYGRDWPIFAQTMIGRRRLAHLRSSVEEVLRDGVPGDLIEAGVWRGGAAIMMLAVLKANGARDRSVWLADSFEGLPEAGAGDHQIDHEIPFHKWSELAVSEEEVRRNLERYGVLDDQSRFLRGWFRDTLPTVAGRTWALIRLDADMYGSTTDALENLYPGLSPGGYVVIDDYDDVPACKRAVDEFRARHAISEPLTRIDWTGAYWRREHSPPAP